MRKIVIPLDKETIRRLKALARFVGKEPEDCAASLLHDIMLDDERENVLALSTQH